VQLKAKTEPDQLNVKCMHENRWCFWCFMQ